MIESARNGLDPAGNRTPPDNRRTVAAAIGAEFLAALGCAGPLIVTLGYNHLMAIVSYDSARARDVQTATAVRALRDTAARLQ